MPELQGLKNNDRARSASSLFLRRPRSEGIVLFNALFHCFRTKNLFVQFDLIVVIRQLEV